MGAYSFFVWFSRLFIFYGPMGTYNNLKIHVGSILQNPIFFYFFSL